MSEEKLSLTRWDACLAIGVGILSLGLYTRTLIPWVLPGDSGEFQVLAYQVGIAHTTGYPIYLLLARLFIALAPVGEIAYRVNLFSAVMGGLAVAGLYLAGRLLTDNRWGALFGALAFSISYTFWSQAVIAETYTAAAAFQVGVWVFLLVWHKTGRKGALFLAALLGGLGLGVHANLALLAPAIGVFLLLNKERWPELWKPALSGGLLGLGLFLIGYLLVDLHAPPANIFNAAYGPARSAWGLTAEDLQNPAARFWFIVSAGQWRDAMFVNPVKDTLQGFADYPARLAREFSLPALLLAGLGIVALWQSRRDRRLAVLFSLALLLHWLYSFNYRIGDNYVLFIPGYLMLSLLAAAGLAGLSPRLSNNRSPTASLSKAPFRARLGKSILEAVILSVIAVGSLAAPGLSPRLDAVKEGRTPFINAKGYLVNDGSKNIYKVAAALTPKFDQNAIVFIDWNQLYPYYYAAHIEQGRLDLQFVEMYPHADAEGLADSSLEFIRSQIDSRPIYFATPAFEVGRAGFKLRPVNFGLIRFYKVEKK